MKTQDSVNQSAKDWKYGYWCYTRHSTISTWRHGCVRRFHNVTFTARGTGKSNAKDCGCTIQIIHRRCACRQFEQNWCLCSVLLYNVVLLHLLRGRICYLITWWLNFHDLHLVDTTVNSNKEAPWWHGEFAPSSSSSLFSRFQNVITCADIQHAGSWFGNRSGQFLISSDPFTSLATRMWSVDVTVPPPLQDSYPRPVKEHIGALPMKAFHMSKNQIVRCYNIMVHASKNLDRSDWIRPDTCIIQSSNPSQIHSFHSM